MNFVRAKSWRRKKSRIGHGGFSNSLCFVYEKTKYIRLNEYSKPHSANIRFFVDKKRLSFGFLELLSRGGIVHNGAVGCCTRHAKFKDSHPIQRRQNRTDASGYAKSLYFTERGLMSGSWGIQDGLSRNNHVVDLCNDSRTRKYLPTGKIYKGNIVMNATLSTVGASACKPSEPNQVNYYSPATLPHLSHEAYALYSLALVGKQAAFDGAVDGVSLGYLLETIETRLSILHRDLEKICKSKGVA